MSSPIGPNVPAGPGGSAPPGYPSYQQPAAPWTVADAVNDTGPIPRWAGAAGPGATGAPGPRRSVDLARLLVLIVAGLGVLNFIWGFLPELTATRSQDSLSVFAVGPAYVPVVLLIGGLLALAVLLPGREVSAPAVAAVSIGGAAGALVSLGTEGPVQLVSSSQVSKGSGAILLVIFGIIQAVVATGAHLMGADGQQWIRARRAAVGRAGAGPAGAPAVPGGAAAVPGGGGRAAAGYPPSPGAPGPTVVQPGWVNPAPRPPHDPRNAPADERPTGPQQVIVGTETRQDRPGSPPAPGTAGPGQVHLDKESGTTPAASPAARSVPQGETGPESGT